MTPRKCYVICSNPRSGSNYLCREMERRGVFGQPGEYFNFFDTMFEYVHGLEARTMSSYVSGLFEHFSSPQGVWGWKSFWLDFKFVHDLSGEFHRFKPLTHIYLDRDDHAEQAVSFAYAGASNAWTSEHKQIADLPYDRAAIDRCVEHLDFNRQQWEEYFTANAIAPLRLEYRALTANVEPILQRLATMLNVTLPPVEARARGALTRQTETAKTEWLSRYRQELADAQAIAPAGPPPGTDQNPSQ